MILTGTIIITIMSLALILIIGKNFDKIKNWMNPKFGSIGSLIILCILGFSIGFIFGASFTGMIVMIFNLILGL
jgi:hypothetical protein